MSACTIPCPSDARAQFLRLLQAYSIPACTVLLRVAPLKLAVRWRAHHLNHLQKLCIHVSCKHCKPFCGTLLPPVAAAKHQKQKSRHKLYPVYNFIAATNRVSLLHKGSLITEPLTSGPGPNRQTACPHWQRCFPAPQPAHHH
jgi:hypothetical protein